MKLIVDTDARTLTHSDQGTDRELPLYSREAFELISREWVRVGWEEKYTYQFTWLGRPIIQLPEDVLRIQEVLYKLRPDVIIETGIAHGGSLVLYAGLCKLLGKGRVIGVDIEIRPHNRQAIEAHELFPLITLIEGSSVDDETVRKVKSLVRAGESAIVLLDSNHTRDHVLAEMEAYCGLVSRGSYMVVADGVMRDLYCVPRGKPAWREDNPASAVRRFLLHHPEFALAIPASPFRETELSEHVTYWPDGWLQRIR